MAVIHRIESPEDPRVAAFLDVRERDLVGRDGRFVAEGEVVLRVLLTRSRFRTEAVLVAERRLEASRSLLALVPDGVPVYEAAQDVVDRIAGFPLHRGLLAIGVRGVEPDAAGLLASLPPRAVVAVLVGVANHDNVGGIFRNAAAFGAAAVLLDGTSCDPLYRKAIRVSVGGCLIVPFVRGGSAASLLDCLDAAGFEALALSPGGGEALSSIRPPPRAALLLGAEGPGLPGPVLARARPVRIPMAGGFDSLNVATTSGIALHHLLGIGQETEQANPSGG